MKKFKKLLAILLVASMIFTTNSVSILAEGQANESESYESRDDQQEEILDKNGSEEENSESLADEEAEPEEDTESKKESFEEEAEEAEEASRGERLSEPAEDEEELEEANEEASRGERLSEPAEEAEASRGEHLSEPALNIATASETKKQKISFGVSEDNVYWAVRQSSSNYTLYLSMTENRIKNNNNINQGSFANDTVFDSEDAVPWNEYRDNMKYLSVYGDIKCNSMSYWFKNTKIENISGNLFIKNELLEDISYAFENSPVKRIQLWASNNLKNMNSAFKNCSKLVYVQTNKTYGYDSVIQKLDENGFKDAFTGCTSLRRINMRFMDFSEYIGDVCSFNNLTKLVKITFYDSGELFNKINLNGEWWTYGSGEKYTSTNMPVSQQVIRKYETFDNTIYWYYKDDNNDEIHLSSEKPTHSNYKNGQYFNGDEANVYGLLPRESADNIIIIIDNDIVLKNDAGSSFFSNIGYGASEIKNIDKLNTSNVTDMSWMFGETNIKQIDLTKFDTSKVTDMQCLFYSCKFLTDVKLTSFNTVKVTDMSEMFYECSSLKTIDLSSFSTESLNDGEEYNDDAAYSMFDKCSALVTIYVSDKFVITYDTDYDDYDGVEMFTDCQNLKGGAGTTWTDDYKYSKYARIDKTGAPGLFTNKSGGSSSDTSITHILNYNWYNETEANLEKQNVTKIKFQQAGNISNWTASWDIDEYGMKGYITNNTEVIIQIPAGDKIKTAENCRLMFSFDDDYNSSLTSIENINILDTSNAKTMSMMFYGNRNLTSLNLSNFNTSNVTNMQNMFEGCHKLVAISGLNKFDTKKVTDMNGLFSSCSSLTNIDLSNFNTYKVSDMSYMFYSCSKITSLDLSTFETYNEPDTEGMFMHCTKLKTIYASDKFNNNDLYNSENMFTNCISLVGGNNTKYNSSIVDKTYARIDKSGTPGYFTSKNKNTNNNSSRNNKQSSGGGSDSGSSSSISAIDNQINQQNNNIQNSYTTTTKTNYNNQNTLVLDNNNVKWSYNQQTGKWNLDILAATNAISISAKGGFVQLNSVNYTYINGVNVPIANNDIYCFDAEGNMITGWVETIDNKWFFFDNTLNSNTQGKMTTGWKQVDGNWYYFSQDGSMLTNGITPDGYYIGPNGLII